LIHFYKRYVFNNIAKMEQRNIYYVIFMIKNLK